MAEAIKLSERTHPLYDENSALWDLYQEAILGGDNFINDENLFSHRLEDTTDFDERLDRAYFLNFCDAVPNIYNFYIFKERIERPEDTDLAEFRKNIDGKGTHINDFIRRIGFLSSVFGAMHILVDMPASNKSTITKAEQKERGMFPYCTPVYPSQLVDWSVDEFGNFNWVIVMSTYYRDEDPMAEREEETHYKCITREKWWIEDEDGNKVSFEDGRPSEGPNPLGLVPLVTIYHKDTNDDKVGESMLKDIVYVNRAILNWTSCIDEQIERQTFSQLVVPDDGTLAEEYETGGDPLRKLGTASVWTFPSDASQPPNFISPNVGTISTIWNLVVDHIKEIFRMAGLLGGSSDMYTSQSGRSAQMGFMGVNAALAEKAKRYQQLENSISKLALRQLGKESRINEYEDVKYPDTFDIAALSDEIDSIFTVMESEMSLELNKQLMKNIARRAAPLAPTSVREAIEKEIDEGEGKVQSRMPRFGEAGEGKDVTNEERSIMAGSRKAKDGNPNSNLGKTTRTKAQRDKEEREHRVEKK